MSRSLGDGHAHKLGVSSKPTLSTYRLGETESFLIIASDGVWGVMSNDEVGQYVEEVNRICTQ